MSLLTAKYLTTTERYPTSHLFSLMIEHRLMKTQIVMKVHSETVNTRDIPWTFDFLSQHLPTVLASTCFNDEKIPFSVEVTRTEIGHLFEHILLEYLCQEKLLRGHDEAVFSGRTHWNWEKEPIGLFHILINIHRSDIEFFPQALAKTVTLMEQMMQYTNPTLQTYPTLTNLVTK